MESLVRTFWFTAAVGLLCVGYNNLSNAPISGTLLIFIGFLYSYAYQCLISK